ncbi:MAG: response regulator [Cryobacterium sp.]|nr:response regulator [Oligoflexia bacterium]
MLILEDVPEMRSWLGELVSGSCPEWSIRTVATSVDFIQMIDRERPDLVLLDEVLGPGEDVASLIRLTHDLGIPVILITGMESDHPRSTVIPPSVMGRITKPHWDTGGGTSDFLNQLRSVMTLTALAGIG